MPDASAEFHAELANQIEALWLCAWLNLRRACGLSPQLAPPGDAAIDRAVKNLRRVYDSASFFHVDLQPMLDQRPHTERQEVFRIAGDALRHAIPSRS